ncbi:NAD(P)-dependent oxidoreductase [Lacticaseibacillus brantae]|uniref:3-hydroxyisobutyrate dehydrogenase n=1 Tax=Lacticaseibacillus brantae DSM 23927 TaxID=1423727 RepID=A0A0R2AYG0_9LACO|nr:NAD(P)-dependent oxidoreductase [Lacticaseibacillus brantae]KRM71797.1 3-hydroxyisobutyrate dehydrogenase [Lacticaseibacillus brantae DSM 23927]
MQLGFIGTGVMGTAIVLNLLKAGHQVTVFNRTKAHAQKTIDAGAVWANSPEAVAAVSEVTFSMVGFPQDVEETYLGDHGIFKGAAAGSTVVDMTTSTPTLAERLAHIGDEHEIHVLDAPVSGGDIGARDATLTVMVGGDRATFEAIKPIFAVIGKTINYFGTAGMGQHAKMANQIMIAGTMTGLTEMLLYAKKAGLDMDQTLATLAGGGANNWSMNAYGPRILAGDYTPGFFAKHFLKDLRIALDEADKMHLNLPATRLAADLYAAMVAAGKGDMGTQGLITTYNGWED